MGCNGLKRGGPQPHGNGDTRKGYEVQVVTAVQKGKVKTA